MAGQLWEPCSSPNTECKLRGVSGRMHYRCCGRTVLTRGSLAGIERLRACFSALERALCIPILTYPRAVKVASCETWSYDPTHAHTVGCCLCEVGDPVAAPRSQWCAKVSSLVGLPHVKLSVTIASCVPLNGGHFPLVWAERLNSHQHIRLVHKLFRGAHGNHCIVHTRQLGRSQLVV